MRQFSTELSHNVSCANAGAATPIAHTAARIIDRRMLAPPPGHVEAIQVLVILRNSVRVWLGGRDSNPDNVVQSHVSYRWTTSQCRSGFSEGARTSDYSQSKSGPASRVRHRDVLMSRRSLGQCVRSLSSLVMVSSLP